MNNSLLLLTSPFNLICFQQAIYDFNIDSAYILCIVYDEHSENHKQLIDKLKSLDINTIEVNFLYHKDIVGNCLQDRIAFYSDAIPLLKNKNFDFVFFSEFRAIWQEDIINTLRNTNTYMLDDGVSTISFLVYHWPKKKIFSLPNQSTKQRKNEANRIKKSLGINLKPFCNISIYTIFEPLFKEQENLILNSLNHLSKEFNTINKNSEMIIGTKLVTTGLIGENEYIYYIKEIINRIDLTKEIIYVPHRGQDKKHIQKLLSACPGLKLLEPKKPIEDWIRNQTKPPYAIHGFISTAFFIINTAYPQIKINCYALPKRYSVSSIKNNYIGSDQYTFHEAAINLQKYLPPEITFTNLDE